MQSRVDLFFMGSGHIGLMMAHNMGRHQTYTPEPMKETKQLCNHV